jgi:predicted transcriptional regulator
MDVLWAVGGDMSGREVAERFPDNAYTTVATVLDRLVNKGLVRRGRAGRTIRFDAVGSPGAHAAAQMHQALAAGQVTEATLVHFARTLSADEAAILRAVLDDAAVPASGSGT